MQCRKARALAHDFLEGTLAAEARARVERHLGTCQRCCRVFDEARRYREAVFGLPRVKVPGDFLSGIRERLGESPAPERRRRAFASPLPKAVPFGLATAAVAAFALVFVLHSLRPAAEKPLERGALSESRVLEEEGGGPPEQEKAARDVSAPAGRPAKSASGKAAVARAVPETESIEAPAGAEESLGSSGVSSETEGNLAAKKEPAGAAGFDIAPSTAEESPAAESVSPAPEAPPGPKAVSITLVLAPPKVDAHSDREAGPKARKGSGRKKAAVRGGEPAVPDPDKTREALLAVIRNAGGRVVGEEPAAAGGEPVPEGQTPEEGSYVERGPEGAFPAILAEIPAPALPDVLKRLGELGQVREDRAFTLPQSAGDAETVELRIRVTY